MIRKSNSISVNLIKNEYKRLRNRCAAKQAASAVLRDVLGIVNVTRLTDFDVLFFFPKPKCDFSVSLKGKRGAFPFFFPLIHCNLLFHLPSEHIINLGERNGDEHQHEAQPSYSVLLNCLCHLHGSRVASEDGERAGVCEGKHLSITRFVLFPPNGSQSDTKIRYIISA